MSLAFWFLVAAAIPLSCALTGWLRRYAVARSLIDLPNHRSSHTTPTPRGGGVAIVVTFISLSSLGWALDLLETTWLVACLGTGGAVAAIGFIDDHRHIAAKWRLMVHLAAAAWGLYWLGGVSIELPWGLGRFSGLVPSAAVLLGIVWLINLYNFMDGIDGLAGVESLSVGIAGCLLVSIAAVGETACLPPLLLAASSIGFLYWNFPKARIFMGDAGSGFLGGMFGLLVAQSSWLQPDLLWGWTILLGVFVVDATVTLARRILRGERFYEAHREHAYQRASRRFNSHVPVTLVAGGINLFWLLPIAAAVVSNRLDGTVGVAIAYLPLVGLALFCCRENSDG